MHNFISMQFFYVSATFFILCLFYCLLSVTLLRVADQNFYIYNKASLKIRTILIIFCQYFYGNNIFNISFNVCLFKRAIFDVLQCLLILNNGVHVLEHFMAGYFCSKTKKLVLIQSWFSSVFFISFIIHSCPSLYWRLVIMN